MSEEEVGTEEIVEDEIIEEEESQEDEGAEEDDNVEDDSEESPEFYDSEADYLKEQGVEDFDSIDDLIQAYKADKDKSVTQQLIPTPTPPAEQESSKTLFDRGNFTSHTKTLLEGQVGLSDEDKKKHLAQAQFNDAVLDPMVKKFEDTFQMVGGVVNTLVKEVRHGSWMRFKHKDLIGGDRTVLDKIMDQYGLLDYNEGFRRLMITDKPELLAKFASRTEQRGVDKGRKLKMKKASAPRRGKQSAKGFDVSKYRNRDGTPNMEVINRIKGTTQQREIVGKILEKQQAE